MSRAALAGVTLVVLIVLALLGLAVAGAAAVDESADEAINVTPPHIHPDELEDDADLDGIQALLSAYLRGNLESSAIDISEQEYEMAREVLGDAYHERLSQLGSIDELTDEDGHPALFEVSRDEQEELADLLEAFDAVYAEYLDAVEAGEEELAVELAQELFILDAEIAELSESLLDSYDRLEELLEIDMETAQSAVIERTDETGSQTASAVEGTLTVTDLEVAIEDEVASFTEPMTVTGTLVTDEGEAVANEVIVLEIEERVVEVTTDADGSFSFEFRPVLSLAGETDVSVAFVPQRGQPYLGDTAADTVVIEQADPTLSLSTEVDTVSFGDEVAFEGLFEVDGEAVPVGELEVRLDDLVESTIAVSAGQFDGSVTVPAAVPAGTAQLVINWPYEDVAIAPETTSIDLEVAETESELTVAGTFGTSITVDGHLSTVAGDPIADQQVAVSLGGHDLGVVVTDEDGVYRGVFEVPAALEAGETDLVATFDGAGTNLESTVVTVVVEVPATDSTGTLALVVRVWDWMTDVAPGWVWGMIVVGVLGLAALGLRWSRGSVSSSAGEFIDEATTRPAPSQVEVPDELADDLLTAAEAHLEASRPAAATVLGYGALRTHLGEDRTGLSAAAFLEEYRGTAPNGHLDAITEVTDGFHRVVFAGEPVEQSAADTYLELVRGVVEPSAG